MTRFKPGVSASFSMCDLNAAPSFIMNQRVMRGVVEDERRLVAVLHRDDALCAFETIHAITFSFG